MYRVGCGYDVHRLAKGRRLMLGGVLVKHTVGLLGHSDGDVLLHAIGDALLGAAALGDLGEQFPDTSREYKDISSITLLKRVAEKVSQCGWQIENIDSTIIAQAPRLKDYLPAMRKAVAEALGIDIGQVSVKATSPEGLGFVGAEEGMAAHSVAMLSSKKARQQQR